MKNLINGKANAATTLAGYGITDGMTATEIASAISTAIAGTDHLTATQRTKTTEKKQQKRETGQPCRKIRYCTAFVYCSSAFEIQGT